MSFQFRDGLGQQDQGQVAHSAIAAALSAGAARTPLAGRLIDIPTTSFYRAFGKRALDLAIVLMASVPVMFTVLLMAFFVALDGHKPWYVQDRVGRNGRVFRMLKLRTMVANADAALAAHLDANPDARREWDHHQKLQNDPRITRVGSILRRTSLDELPQLWNVFNGTMSIVGPRPMMISQREMYTGQEYFEMRPGITGFWQVSVRNQSSFLERAKFDRSYFREMSLLTDIGVIARTFRVVVRATGR